MHCMLNAGGSQRQESAWDTLTHNSSGEQNPGFQPGNFTGNLLRGRHSHFSWWLALAGYGWKEKAFHLLFENWSYRSRPCSVPWRLEMGFLQELRLSSLKTKTVIYTFIERSAVEIFLQQLDKSRLLVPLLPTVLCYCFSLREGWGTSKYPCFLALPLPVCTKQPNISFWHSGPKHLWCLIFLLGCRGLDADAQGCLILPDGIEMLFFGHRHSSCRIWVTQDQGILCHLDPVWSPVTLGRRVCGITLHPASLSLAAINPLPLPQLWLSLPGLIYFSRAHTVMVEMIACSRSSTWDEIFSSWECCWKNKAVSVSCQHPHVGSVFAWPLLWGALILPDLSPSLPSFKSFSLCFISTYVSSSSGSSLGTGADCSGDPANHSSDAADGITPWGSTRLLCGHWVSNCRKGAGKPDIWVHQLELSSPPQGDGFWSPSSLPTLWTWPDTPSSFPSTATQRGALSWLWELSTNNSQIMEIPTMCPQHWHGSEPCKKRAALFVTWSTWKNYTNPSM